MKAIIIKGLELPESPNGLMDLRIYGDGSVQVVGCMGNAASAGKAVEIEIPDED